VDLTQQVLNPPFGKLLDQRHQGGRIKSAVVERQPLQPRTLELPLAVTVLILRHVDSDQFIGTIHKTYQGTGTAANIEMPSTQPQGVLDYLERQMMPFGLDTANAMEHMIVMAGSIDSQSKDSKMESSI